MNVQDMFYVIVGLLSAILAVLIYIAVMGARKAGELGAWALWMAREPVRIRTAIGAIVGILAQFGLDLTDQQHAALVGGIIVLAALVSEFSRRKVTPVEYPNLPDKAV